MNGEWRAQAACLSVDPELFYPAAGEWAKPARDVCRGCPVREDCLEHALAVPEKLGVWGGLDPDEREKLRRKRGAA